MPSPVPQPSQDPAPAPLQMPPAMPPKHHSHVGMWILGFVMLALILALVGVAIFLVQDASDSEIATGDAQALASETRTELEETQAELQDTKMELEDLREELAELENQSAGNKFYIGGPFSFEYPNGWHIYATAFYDNPNRSTPEFTAALSPDPVTLISPREGTYFTPFYFRVVDENEDVIEHYTSIDNEYQTVMTENIVVNGQNAVLVLIQSDTSVILTSQYQEILIIDDVEIVYSYSDQGAHPDVWETIMNTIEVK